MRKTKIGQYIENERKKRCLSYREFAKFIGIDHALLHRYEHGISPVSCRSLIKLSGKLRVKLSYLQWLCGKVPAELHELDLTESEFTSLTETLSTLSKHDILDAFLME